MSKTEKLFVYGTLRRGGTISGVLQDRIGSRERATVSGVLLETDGLPFLIHDRESLRRVHQTYGIDAHPVQGELAEILDEDLFERLDPLETIRPPHERRSGEPGAEHYMRVRTEVQCESGPEQAWVYIANPQKSHTRRLATRPSNRIIVPGGDWKDYLQVRSRRSFSTETHGFSSFGMETEFEIRAFDEGRWRSITNMRHRGQYKVHTGVGVRHYKRLGGLLAQMLFASLKNEKNLGTLQRYYERRPRINSRFPIPFGVAYIDGEGVDLSGESGSGISPVPRTEGEIMTLEDLASRSEPTSRIDFESDVRFFETAGIPAVIEPGLAERATREEMMRRSVLTNAVSKLEGIESQGNVFEQLALFGHSSHYSVRLQSDFNAVDLCEPKVWVRQAERDRHRPGGTYFQGPEKDRPKGEWREVSKFTADLAYILGKTYGPLLSYFLSGGQQGHIDFKPRANNRIEYRNTVLNSPAQLQAGISVFVAACRTVEENIRETLEERIRDENSLKSSSILSIYDGLYPDEILSELPFQVLDLQYGPSSFRPGFRVPHDASYHRAAYENTPFRVRTHNDEREISLHDAVRILFYSPEFNEKLRAITTPDTYEQITNVVESAAVESRTASHGAIDSFDLSGEVQRVATNSSGEYSSSNLTYPDFFTHLLFRQNGRYVFEDELHRLVLQIPQNVGVEESDIYLDSIPLSAQLLKKEGDSYSRVDSFPIRITPGNFHILRASMDERHNLSETPVWHTFYRMK